MSGKAFNFISKANQYLLFVGSLLFLIFFSYLFIKDFLFKTPYQPPKVEIVATQENTQKQELIRYKKHYVTSIKNVHILDIKANKISPDTEHDRADIKVEMFNGFSGSSYDKHYSSSMVNIMFVTEEQANYLLFKQDKFIEKRVFARFENEQVDYGRSFISFKNAYLVAEEDTNQDGYLSKDDRLNFYLSDYDGKNLKLLLGGVNYFKYLKDHQLLLSSGKGVDESFYILDTETEILQKLNTRID